MKFLQVVARSVATRLLLLPLLASAPFGIAQPQSETPHQLLEPDGQEYFLLQAFHARLATERREFHHLGLLAEADGQGYRVGAVLDGLPAQQAGLRRGDLLVAIDDQPFHPVLSLNPHFGDGDGNGSAAWQQPRLVELTYQRGGNTHRVTLHTVFGNLYDAFRSATLNSVQQFSSGNKLIGYVKLWTIDRSTDGLLQFSQLIASLAHCDGLILDVRDSYGFLSTDHLDHFFPSRNSYFQLQGQAPGLWPEHPEMRQRADYYGRQLVVIQNQGTRGGMELFAYQLGKMERAVLLGQNSSGKAGQVIMDRDSARLVYVPGTEVRLDGAVLEGQGIAVEQEVPYPLDTTAVSDLQIDAAVLALLQIM